MSIQSTEMPKIKSYRKDLHARVIYEYIVNNKTQAQIADLLAWDDGWTVSAIVRAYNFNRERSASYQGGKDKGKYRGTDRELVNTYVNLYYPGFVNDDRMTFDKFLEEHRKKRVVHKPPAAIPRPQSHHTPKLQNAVPKPAVAAPKPPTAEELFQRALQLRRSRPQSRELEGLFRQAAELGHIEALYYLALFYKENGSSGGDYVQALSWFQKAVDRGCPHAKRFYEEFLYELAVKAAKHHEYRVVVPCYEKAARAGHSDAANELGVLYAKGEGIGRNDRNAVYWYEIAAKGGNTYGMWNLAHCYLTGAGVKKSRLQALYWFEQGAARGHSGAKEQSAILSYQIGERYLNSQEEHERSKAFAYFQKSIDYGNQDALFYLGFCHANGIGVQSNARRAAEYYEHAAKGGSAAAMNNLGVLYAKGEGMDHSDQHAAYYYEQAASQGDPVAMRNLAYCYKKGKGCEKNTFQAVHWFEQAAERGDNEAKREAAEGAYSIGEHYLKSSVLNEKEKAYAYFRKALKYGNNKALLQIGNCLENGYGVKPSYEHAVQYYEQAYSAGVAGADAWLADCYFEWAKELQEHYCYDEAIALLKKGAALDHEDCMLYLGNCYFEGNGVYTDDNTSAYWYKEAASARFSGKSVEEHYMEAAERCMADSDYERGAEWYKRAAELGYAAAMNALGGHYSGLDSDSGHSDYKQAVEWYKKAMEMDDYSCEWDLNRCYLKLGEQALLEEAVEAALGWYQEARELFESGDYRSGLHECYCRLARAAVDEGRHSAAMEYYRQAEEYGGPGSEEADWLAQIGDWLDAELWESALAEEWYEKAAGLGHAAAGKIMAERYFSLARQYELEQEEEQSLLYYQKAAEAGDDLAQMQMGHAYEFGKGTRTDYDAAFHWYNLAAEQENGEAHEKLGSLLQHGKVNRHDGAMTRLRMAAFRYEQAFRLGNERAKSSLISCNHQLAEEYEAAMNFAQAVKIYRQMVELGNTSSLNALGLAYLKGVGVPLDYKEAAGCFRQAADLGDIWGEQYLDRLFGQGEDVPGEYQQYEQWYRQAADLGDSAALRQLGLFYMAGHEGEPDYKTAVYWLEQAAKQGEERAAAEVVEAYALLAEDYDKWSNDAWAYHYYKKAAELGHAESQNMVGIYYARGIEVVQNQRLAAQWFEQSAQKGSSFGQYHLGAAYEGSQGVDRNEEAAVFWYEKSALQGNYYAKHALAAMYKEGRGVPADLGKAEALMEEAYLQGCPIIDNESDKLLVPLADLYTLKYAGAYGAKLIEFYERLAEAQQDNNMWYEIGLAYETGYSSSLAIPLETDMGKAFYGYKQAVEIGGSVIFEAIHKLGDCYRHGVGTERDIPKAVEVLEHAAEWNDPEALNVIGECYFSGEGVERNHDKTFEYCMRAAEQGHAEAQYNVGFCFENGCGAEPNMEKAMEWYGKSAELGFALAMEQLERISGGTISPEISHVEDTPAAAFEIDESLDVNELIWLMGKASAKEEKFYYQQVIHEKMHNSMYGPRDGNEIMVLGEENGTEIRAFHLMGEKIHYAVTNEDKAVITIINEHIKIYVPGGTLIISRDYAMQHLSAKVISYAVEENEVFLWKLGGNGTAVVFELASLLDEEQNESIMYMRLMRFCPDYLQEFELFGDKFKEAYRQNLQKQKQL